MQTLEVVHEQQVAKLQAQVGCWLLVAGWSLVGGARTCTLIDSSDFILSDLICFAFILLFEN